ncbi:hypothetical protein Dimus_026462, partial [Dionaea muscipula]
RRSGCPRCRQEQQRRLTWCGLSSTMDDGGRRLVVGRRRRVVAGEQRDGEWWWWREAGDGCPGWWRDDLGWANKKKNWREGDEGGCVAGGGRWQRWVQEDDDGRCFSPGEKEMEMGGG